MIARKAALAAVAAASVFTAVHGDGQNIQSANANDRALAAALSVRDTARAVRLASEALSIPLPLPPEHPASEVLGAGLRARVPALLSNAPPGALSSAHLNNLGVALALRGWTESAAVVFNGALLVAEAQTAGTRWGPAIVPFGSVAPNQSAQYFSSTPNPVVVNVENLVRLVKPSVGSTEPGGRGRYEFFNGLLEAAEKRATPSERLRAMAEVFPPIVSRSLADALSARNAPGSPSTFDRDYRAFAQYKGKYLRSLDTRRARRLAAAASQSEDWDDRGLYGFDPATRLKPGEVFVDIYLVELGDRIAALRREYVAVVVSAALRGGQQTPATAPRVVTLGRAAAVDDAVDDLWADLESSSPKPLEALAARVWAPIATALPPGTRRIWLSPDGRLGPVPWQALALSSGNPTATVSIVDSGETIREPRSRPPARSASILLVGNPDFGNGPGARFAPLRHTADEIKAVEDVVRSTELQPTVLMGASVDRARLLNALPARIVHVSTHGEFRDAPERASIRSVGPWLVLDADLRATGANDAPTLRGPSLDVAALQQQMAALGETARRTGKAPTPEQVRAAMEQAQTATRRQAFSPLTQAVLALSGANAARDPFAPSASAFLSDVDLAATDLSATDLVVLPACNLGGSSQSGFQGLMSMQGAVVLAGARGLIASLWPVSDAEAVAFMRQFYSNLLVRKLPAADALREAQRTASVDAAGHPRSPFLWAGWMFFGEGW